MRFSCRTCQPCHACAARPRSDEEAAPLQMRARCQRRAIRAQSSASTSVLSQESRCISSHKTRNTCKPWAADEAGYRLREPFDMPASIVASGRRCARAPKRRRRQWLPCASVCLKWQTWQTWQTWRPWRMHRLGVNRRSGRSRRRRGSGPRPGPSRAAPARSVPRPGSARPVAGGAGSYSGPPATVSASIFPMVERWPRIRPTASRNRSRISNVTAGPSSSRTATPSPVVTTP